MFNPFKKCVMGIFNDFKKMYEEMDDEIPQSE